MADFSVDFTQAQGAGANPVSPVQNPVGHAPDYTHLVGDLAKTFFAYKQASKEQEKIDLKSSVIDSYVQEQKRINEAVSQGLDRGRAATQQRAITMKYMANYSGLIKEIQDVNENLLAGTDLGVNIEEEKAARKAQQDLYNGAVQSGFPLTPDTPKEVKEAFLTTYQMQKRTEDEFKRMVEKDKHVAFKNEEERKSFEYLRKEEVTKQISQLGVAHVDSASALLTSLTAAPDKNAAKLQFSTHITMLRSNLQKIAGQDTNLVAGWNSILTDLEKTANDQLSPDKDSKALEDQLKMVKTRAQLMMLSDPKMQAAYAGNTLIPGAFNALSQVQLLDYKDDILRATAYITGKAGDPTQVVGVPNVDKGVYTGFKQGLKDLESPNPYEADRKKVELKTGLNNMLDQVSKAWGAGVEPKNLKETFNFIASPEYDRMNRMGLIDPARAATANQVFQDYYLKNVAKAVEEKLGQNAYGSVTYGDLVDFKMSGGVVVMQPLDRILSKENQAERTKVMGESKVLMESINNLVKAGAHLAGTSDYAGYWEKSKGLILPQYFTPEGEPKRTNGREVRGKIKGATAPATPSTSSANWWEQQ